MQLTESAHQQQAIICFAFGLTNNLESLCQGGGLALLQAKNQGCLPCSPNRRHQFIWQPRHWATSETFLEALHQLRRLFRGWSMTEQLGAPQQINSFPFHGIAARQP